VHLMSVLDIILDRFTGPEPEQPPIRRRYAFPAPLRTGQHVSVLAFARAA